MPLTKEEVLKRMKDPSVVLLNIQPENEFEKLHIKPSHNLALGQNIRGFAMAVLKKYGKQAFFITYGADESSSAGLNAARVLIDKGMTADNYPGGIREWSKAGLPTEGPRTGTTSRS